MSTAIPRLISALALLAAATAGQAHDHAHQHGVARLDVAVDGPTLSLQLEAPLDSLLGFERRPRTEAERQAVAAMLARLRDGAALWTPEAGAQCRFEGAQLETLLLNEAAPGAQEDDHLDLDAAYTFRCAQPQQLRQLGLGLFQAFPRLQRLEVQVAGPGGQSRQVIKRPKSPSSPSQPQLKLGR